MSNATCRTCGGEVPNHVPSPLDPSGIGDPAHAMTNSKKDSTIQCNKCGKTFINEPVTIACAVMHLDGQCCHYGMKEVVDSQKDSELKLDCSDLSHEQVTKILKWHNAVMKSKYITKQEVSEILDSHNMPLEMKKITALPYSQMIVDYGMHVSLHNLASELRELLKGDKQ